MLLHIRHNRQMDRVLPPANDDAQSALDLLSDTLRRLPILQLPGVTIHFTATAALLVHLLLSLVVPPPVVATPAATHDPTTHKSTMPQQQQQQEQQFDCSKPESLFSLFSLHNTTTGTPIHGINLQAVCTEIHWDGNGSPVVHDGHTATVANSWLRPPESGSRT